MLGHGKLSNLRPTDEGLVAEITIEGMTPAMAEAVIAHARVELALLTERPRVPGAGRAVELVQAAQEAA